MNPIYYFWANGFLTPNFEGVKINQTIHSKALGLNTDENLSWKQHIRELSKTEVASSISALKRVRPFIPLNTAIKALIEPHFDYCSVV